MIYILQLIFFFYNKQIFLDSPSNTLFVRHRFAIIGWRYLCNTFILNFHKITTGNNVFSTRFLMLLFPDLCQNSSFQLTVVVNTIVHNF